tara:strand:+ start:51 stop:965 length:915 start_codon:yes stop_codon:yes gene_type:complete
MSFLILVYEVFFILLVGLLVTGKFKETGSTLEGPMDDIIFYSLMFFLIPGLLYFIDYFLFGILKKIKWKPFAFCYYYIDKFYKYATLVFIYDHLYYTFISNVKRRIIFGLFLFYIIINALLDPVNERTFFPGSDSNSQHLMQYYYYENQFHKIEKKDEESYPESIFINSEIIFSNYLKLYIPYIPTINKSLKKICPNIIDINDDAGSDKEKEVLDCINLAYNVFIGDQQIESDFIFYLYPHEYTNIETFFMIVPLNEIEDGKHVLKIIKNVKAEGEISVGPRSVELDRPGINSIGLIPFYLQRN